MVSKETCCFPFQNTESVHCSMKKIVPILLGCCFILFASSAAAQLAIDSVATVTAKDSSHPKRLKVGLGFGLNFVGGTNLSLSPSLTYNVTKNLAIGGGLLFNYAAIKNIQKTTTFGINALVNYTPTKIILTTLEFSEMNVSSQSYISNTKNNFWESALFLGAGLQVTPKISLGAKYNLLYNKNKSVYTSPVVPFINVSF